MRFTFLFLRTLYVLLVLSCLLFSCTVVKDYPVGKPFVYNNIINITGNLDKDEKKRLTNELSTYWDDSLFARKVQQFGVRYVLKKPPVFDTANISRTKLFMTGYLNTQGYYNIRFPGLDSSYLPFDTVDNQIRTTITINIDPGKNTIIDSLSFHLNNVYLDSISNAFKKYSIITPGKTPFSKQVIANELDRLVALYRQKGNFLISRENLIAEVDTTDLSLLAITLDPFEQAQKIAQAAEKRKKNPTSIVDIQSRMEADSSVALADSIYFLQYHVGHIYYYPETERYGLLGNPDSLITHSNQLTQTDIENYSVLYRKNLFRSQVLSEHTFQPFGALYNEESFYKTLNNFNQMGAWERVDYRTIVHNDTVDFHYFLTPAKKQTISFNLEASRNTGDFLSSGNLIGLALNTTYINRNVWHRAIQSTTALSNGVEFNFAQNNSLLQTIQSSLTHTYTFPRLITPFKIKQSGKTDALKTQLSLSAAYSERKDYFRIRSFVTGWGYSWRKKNVLWQYRPLNIELYSLDKLPLLDSAILVNPFLKTSFNTGSIVSQQLSFSLTYNDKHKSSNSNLVRVSLEESGALLGRFSAFRDNIYQYIKLEAEYRKLISRKKSAIALRAMGGIGYNYGSADKFGNTLPFYKQFIAGGPNSMRAWGLRLLGLGSSLVSDTSSSFRDRYGDMQMEANAEYRFTLAQFSSVKIGGALFTDIGNLWNLHEDALAPGSKFSLANLGKDLAIGVGTGIRFDFSYFLIRVDMGFKLKDPVRSANNGWLNIADFTWKNYEYSVKNPTTGKYSPPTRNNYAIQLGIGMPF